MATSLFEADQEKLKATRMKDETVKAQVKVEGLLEEVIDQFMAGYEKALSYT